LSRRSKKSVAVTIGAGVPLLVGEFDDVGSADEFEQAARSNAQVIIVNDLRIGIA
jgi:hypothetical protein